MKKKFKIFVLLGLIFISIVIIILISKNRFPYKFVDLKANINELYIYGNHLNMKGNIKIKDDLKEMYLVLFDKTEKTYELIFEKKEEQLEFYLSSKKNNGLLLDELKEGNHITFIKTVDQKNNIKYIPLNNNTSYKETNYYTIRKNNKFNNIIIKNNKKNTLNIKVANSNKKEIYDVVIDAGHGGIDVGACYKGVCETAFTYDLSIKLKEELEKNGLKVKLTRNDLKNNEIFSTYGENGRIETAMNSKAKYLFSFHLNSGLATRTGTEIYTTNNIDYNLARSIVSSIVKNTNTDYSNNTVFKIENGIYTRMFKNYEINDAKKEAQEKNYEPYNITNDTTYYYIIRETGGFMTGAYVDGRYKEENEYYNTNVGIESYIMELGYITNEKDSQDITNNMDNYIKAIAEAIIKNICE